MLPDLWLGDNFSSPIRRAKFDLGSKRSRVLWLLSCFKNMFSLFFTEWTRSLGFTKFRTIILLWNSRKRNRHSTSIRTSNKPPDCYTKKAFNDFKHPTWVFNVFQRRSFISIPNVIYLQCCCLAKIALRKNVSGWDFTSSANMELCLHRPVKTHWRHLELFGKGSAKKFQYVTRSDKIQS